MFTIREAKLTDAPALAALMCELGYETTPAEMRRRLKSILCDVGYRTFLAEVDGKVCGMTERSPTTALCITILAGELWLWL